MRPPEHVLLRPTAETWQRPSAPGWRTVAVAARTGRRALRRDGEHAKDR
jgi:hypothetical protein